MFNFSDRDLCVFFAAVAAILVGLGVLLAWLVPVVWRWVKPLLHALTA